MPACSDTELVQSARAGDEKAFERLVEKYRVRIFATISAFISNPQDREDIAQDTIINAYRSLHQLSEPERFGSWLDTIAQNQCRDWMRRNRVQTVPIEDVEENLLNREDSPDQNFVEAEQRRIIAQAIETLPLTERQIARAHYLEGASHDELVSRHGISYQSVSSRLFRAKRKLAKRLRHLLGGVLVPPTTTLKNISSGGYTAMKVGTVPKITAGVIAIITLVFIGSHQLLSPEEDSSPSAEVTTSITNKPEQSALEIDATRRNMVTAPSRADEPKISAGEMEQIEDFFAQLEAADAQSETETSQLATDVDANQDTEEDYTPDSSATFESTEQSAEDVMGAYVEALKNLDSKAILSLMPATVSGEFRDLWVDFDSNPTTALRKVLQEAFGQAEIVSSKHVGSEFHFRLKVWLPIGLALEALEKAELPEGALEEFLPPEMLKFLETPKSVVLLHKMKKENGAWRIYES